MQGLLISGGDLVIAPGGYAEISGQAKVIQDLGVALREDYGLDRFHPRYGSLLYRYIGRPINAETALLIQSEIKRVIQNYMLIQQNNIATDATSGVKSRYSSDEVITEITNVDVQGYYDSFQATVTIRFGNGRTVSTTVNQAA